MPLQELYLGRLPLPLPSRLNPVLFSIFFSMSGKVPRAIRCLRLFALHPVFTQSKELCVTQVVVGRPFQEFKRCYQDRL